jgi:DNA-binding beta-propeller fold protein YncE
LPTLANAQLQKLSSTHVGINPPTGPDVTVNFLNVLLVGNSTSLPAKVWFEFRVNDQTVRFPDSGKSLDLAKGLRFTLPRNLSLSTNLTLGTNEEIVFVPPPLQVAVTAVDFSLLPHNCNNLAVKTTDPNFPNLINLCSRSNSVHQPFQLIVKNYNKTNNFGEGLHTVMTDNFQGQYFIISYKINVHHIPSGQSEELINLPATRPQIFNSSIGGLLRLSKATSNPTIRPQFIPNTEAAQAGCIHDYTFGYDIGSLKPEWVNTLESPDPRVLYGQVVTSGVAVNDWPYSHDSHDFIFDVFPFNQYENLLSNTPKREEGLPVMENEWDHQYIPKEFWPVAGDDVWMMGRHVWDCGHEPYTTEIHPPQALASMHPEAVIFSGDTAPSLATRTSFYTDGRGGDFDAGNSFPLRRNYAFDILLPPKPSNNAQIHAEVSSYFGGPAPLLEPIYGSNLGGLATFRNPPRVHVIFPLAATDVNYAFTWDAFTPDPSLGLAAEKDHILNYLIKNLGMKWIDPQNSRISFLNKVSFASASGGSSAGLDDKREVPTIVIRGPLITTGPSISPNPLPIYQDSYDIVLTCDANRTSPNGYVTLFSTSPPGPTLAESTMFPESGGNLKAPSPNIPSWNKVAGIVTQFGLAPSAFQYTHFFQAKKNAMGQFLIYDYNPQDQQNFRYGAVVYAGWHEPILSQGYHTLKVTFDSLDINNPHITNYIPGPCGIPIVCGPDTPVSSILHVWVRAAGQWLDIPDFEPSGANYGYPIPVEPITLGNRMVQIIIPEDSQTTLYHNSFVFGVQSTGFKTGNIDAIFGFRQTYGDWDPYDDYIAGYIGEAPQQRDIALGQVGGKFGTMYKFDRSNPSLSLGLLPSKHDEGSQHNDEQVNYNGNAYTYVTQNDMTLHYSIEEINKYAPGSLTNKNLNAGTFLTKWGSFGSLPGQFGSNSTYPTPIVGPFNVAFDPSDPVDGPVLYVTDPVNSRIQKFNAAGTFIREWGDGDGGMNPFGITVDPSTHDVYVSDSSHHRVEQFTDIGVLVRKWGEFGEGHGQFDSPEAIAVDPHGRFVYVADGHARIQKFTSDGQFVMQFGSRGIEDGNFSSTPKGLAVDSFGNVYVSDTFNFRIQKFDSNGSVIMKWGNGPDSGVGEFGLGADNGGPHGIAVDNRTGNVYVADLGNNRIQVFDHLGKFLWEIGPHGTQAGQFNQPMGIDVSPFGAAYVADSNNGRIQAFVAH